MSFAVIREESVERDSVVIHGISHEIVSDKLFECGVCECMVLQGVLYYKQWDIKGYQIKY